MAGLRVILASRLQDYYDPNNMQFGPMRVLNDDVVQPLRGFGQHPPS